MRVLQHLREMWKFSKRCVSSYLSVEGIFYNLLMFTVSGGCGMLSCCFSNLLVRQFNLGKSLNYTYVSVNIIIFR